MEIKNFKKILQYSVGTMFVKPSGKEDYAPTNLLLIAGAECGKTRLLNEIKCQKVYKTIDLSPKNIKEALIPRIETGEIKTIIIPDIIQMLGHKKTTVKSTIGFLNALIEEGVKDNNFYGLEFHLSNTIFCGLMTATTINKFFENIYEWNSIGFLHRIIPICYDYSPETVNKIQKEIASGKMFKEINEIPIKKMKDKPIEIKIPEKYSEDINILVNRITDRLSKFVLRTYKGSKNRTERDVTFDIKGFRLHVRLRQLVRAICFINSKGKRKEVNSEDITELYSVSEVINLPNTKKVI